MSSQIATFYSPRLRREVAVPHGACNWYALHNINKTNIRKCRYGFLCRYVHLTQDEITEILGDGDRVIECPTCLKHKEPIDESLDRLERATIYARREMHKMYCRNRTTRRQQILEEASKRGIHCECMGKRSATFYPKDSGHKASNCWICDQCNCIQSMG